MSSLVVTAGTTYEGVGVENVDSLVVEYPDPDLAPDIQELIRPSTDYGYNHNDRNEILNSVRAESKKHRTDESPPVKIRYVDLEGEKKKGEDDDNEDDDNEPDDNNDNKTIDGGLDDLLFHDVQYEGGEYEGGDPSVFFDW
jgi:hypothetical protein